MEPKEQFKEWEWKCTECDYIYSGEESPEQCPKCHAPKEAFVLLEELEEESK
ncbi:MAG: Rubredoxin-type Fe(Cys)4 protein [Parcubacteria group bacterium GW2011_GWD2_38_12]|nr:MAG: Rubredoxin-type Fe(Cys)4 protein [Parcubacteria group bacterium GW2011_GWC2_36_17]KKQ42388.1 MAG: Rubredoxin-type Fe(Cys)4 protein [Parcubacteria group bacterium GW2011_GWE2_37_8]KKQ52906.1 MAG: Rubredoxin-type Fe(Cys)4 protein [Parcubacteria group bacterium GW2011_GWD2_38_12]KKQ59109.1 MAG: Rubredoxin-type Fe(Cys)4 protein [Parcubacteria group bacterium GW2011_GWC1_38_17]KKQ59724.1 MAG: Rubredoxin-type Fe(Cys)4 protein [Parcubacteria group bacterium GW2011_GWD1_38_16]